MLRKIGNDAVQERDADLAGRRLGRGVDDQDVALVDAAGAPFVVEDAHRVEARRLQVQEPRQVENDSSL
ncbi:hypothetical protein [Rubrimonas cliftonensis]|uniref:hypothetical protein n=1 Tax=Rubrimonas cliftonensis TaxID=89524 RepID=UPI000B80CB18|nr:hypothetical protein [Rubrimonas cliftonensis]